jgi:hypothetical protein
MKLLSQISTSIQTIPVSTANGGRPINTIARVVIESFDILEERGDNITPDKKFDVIFDRTYLYGVWPTSVCISPTEIGYDRVWKCVADGVRMVAPGTNIFSARKTIVMEREQRTAAVRTYTQLEWLRIRDPNAVLGIISIGCNT